ncbi:MAG: AEC family transporter [Chloroflexi bacterium]|nr:AEC family transporter [Chloroflexota bacterium]
MQELIQIFVDNMIPVLAIVGVGFFLRRRFAVDARMVSRMMFNVFSPALIFNALFTRDISGADFLRVYGGTLLLLWTIAGISLFALRWRKIEASERAATLVSTFAFNGGNFGLSIVSFAFGAEALSYAVLIFVAGTTTGYTLGVYISSNGKASVLSSLLNVLKTPSVYALLLVFALKGAGITELPPAVARTSQLLADAAIPLMLVLLGLQLGGFGKLKRLPLVAFSTAVRLLLAPAIAIVFASLLGLSGAARFAFIIQAGMPTAVMTIVLATEFDTDRDLALSVILTSSFICPITLSLLIYLLQNGII